MSRAIRNTKYERDITAEKEVCGCGADMTMWGGGKAVKEI
jgi:hypothetical protein